MKTLLTLFVLFFSSSVLADDISDFEIEGMSLGDNIQDHFSKNQLEQFYRSFGKQHTAVEVYSNEGINHPRYFKLQTYDGMQVHYDDSKSLSLNELFGKNSDFINNISIFLDSEIKSIQEIFDNFDKIL